MKYLKNIMIAAVICFGAMTLTGCDRVQPGEVGIKVNKLGDDKGIGEVVGVGRVWTGWNTELYVFPTFKQMKTYSKPFYFQLSDGASIGHQVGVAYRVDPSKVTEVFQTYRKNVEDITETDLRQKIEDILNKRGSKINIDKFIDGGKAELLDSALKDLQEDLGPQGIKVLSLSWVGSPIYTDSVKDSINAKVNAAQKTLQRQQEIAQSTAEANKKIEEARGEKESQILRAQGEADSINLTGDALRKNPEVLKYKMVDKWNGKLPVYQSNGQDSALINLPEVK